MNIKISKHLNIGKLNGDLYKPAKIIKAQGKCFVYPLLLILYTMI